MTELVVATRSGHKLREIAEILGDLQGVELLDLETAGVPFDPAEEGIEEFETFEENALAKARYFAGRAHRPVLADDSGLCVDFLDGAPGVYSKRFSGRSDLSGEELDRANNERLLRELDGVVPAARGAAYVCVIALVLPDRRDEIFRGTVAGRILSTPRGSGGFGYDPLFFLPELDATLAEISREEKNLRSHRANALRKATPSLLELGRTAAS